jgi:hypothetical protein
MFLQTPQQSPPETPVAQEVRVEQTEPSWTFTVEPFIWFAGLDGQGSADSSPPIDLGLSPSDVFGHLDGGFLLALEARAPEQRWSVIADGLYLRLKDDEGSMHTETEAAMLELGGAFPVTDSGKVDVIAGLRYVDLSFDVQIGSAVDATATQEWVEPWIGARGRIPFNETWSLALRGDIGGFGIGSQFTWQAAAVLGAELGAGWRFDIGYRAIGIDYDDGDLSFDTRIHGPLLGFAWQG